MISNDQIAKLVNEHFDLRPKGIIQMLDLLRPIFSNTAASGQFGRDEPNFAWESMNRAATLREEAGLKISLELGSSIKMRRNQLQISKLL